MLSTLAMIEGFNAAIHNIHAYIVVKPQLQASHNTNTIYTHGIVAEQNSTVQYRAELNR